MDENDTPRHIGYIVDGNRRWAKAHGLPPYEGHLAGYDAVQEVVRATFEAGVKYVSAYVFSTENWKRSQDEVNRLMGLALKIAKSDMDTLLDNNVQVRVLGAREGVDPKILAAIDDIEARSAGNTAGTLALCFNYGGQLEIAEALKNMVAAGVKPEDISPEIIGQHLYAPDIPPVDLIVRTGGEQRISNFMLWRAAYSELLFLDKFWPDMTKEDVTFILKEYSERNRRFGG